VQRDDLRLLSELPLFRELTTTELMMVLMATNKKQYEPGQVIVREGNEGDSLFIVKEGEVEVRKYDGKGSEHQLATLGPGECFGEISLIDSEPRSASVYAQTDCTLYRITRNNFADLILHHKEIERKFYKAISITLAQRLRRVNEYLTFNLEVGEMISEMEKKD